MIVYETISGIALLNTDYSIITFYKYINNQEAYNTTKSIRNGILPSPIITHLEQYLSTATELYVTDQRLIRPLKERFPLTISQLKNLHTLKETVKLPVPPEELRATTLFVAHKLATEDVHLHSENTEKVIIEGINLLEDLERDINIHVMKIKEWYSFHFPELAAICPENREYLHALLIIGRKEEWSEEQKKKLEEIIGDRAESVEKVMKISMGTEMEELDMQRILIQAKSILDSWEYTKETEEYLKQRMEEIAPNLTALVGETVGAKLISKAGSLSDLSKCPASTLQILGAEKALFNALRSKANTPKFGVIYHAPIISEAPMHLKGKVARVLAAKAVIAVRVDFFGDKKNVAKEFLKDIEKKVKILEMKGKPRKK